MRDRESTPHRMFVRQDLHMLRHVPKIITMYEWATKVFAFRYSASDVEEQASCEYLEDAIASLPIGKREFGNLIVQEFLGCWDELQKHFETYMQCGHELAENSPIPAFVSKDVDAFLALRVNDVVSLRDDENEGFGAGCHLIRMLKKLLQMQEDALKLPELLEILDPESPDAINRFAFCAQAMPDFDVRASEIPKHEWLRHLITTEVMASGPNEHAEADDSPLLFALIANSSIVVDPQAAGGRRCQYDYQTITRIVMRYIVNGRFPLTIMTDLPKGAPPGPPFYQTLKVKPLP
jgi:hypothetical protein